MKRNYWRTYELKKLGLHPNTIRAIMRIQRRHQYNDQKQQELKTRVMEILSTRTMYF